MARATGSITYLEHRTPLKDESGKYQIHPMFVKRDIVDQEKMEKRVRDHCAMNVSSFISALETLEDGKRLRVYTLHNSKKAVTAD